MAKGGTRSPFGILTFPEGGSKEELTGGQWRGHGVPGRLALSSGGTVGKREHSIEAQRLESQLRSPDSRAREGDG